MKKDSKVERLLKEAEAKNVREAKISFQDHERTVRFVAEKEIKSQHQNIIIGRNESLGRLLVIDDEVQFTERDRSTYHELMVWPGMISVMDRKRRPKPNVAIYGGGDGLAAAEVLKFGVVPTIVDLDASVINVCRDHFSDLNQGSLNMSNVVIGDALKHVPEEKYDFIMIDLTAQSACPFLYDEAAIAKYKSDLAVDGVILFYAEYMMAGEFYHGLYRHFQCSFPYGAFTQFVDSYFTFCLFSDWNINVPKIKRTRREGRYFCRKHIHELDFNFIPSMPFKETFEVSKVAEISLKG